MRWLLTIFLLFTVATAQRIILEDLNPTEPFLSVLLNLYGMNWVHPIHYERLSRVLSNFEVDPGEFFHDQICLEIVIEQLIIGFEMQSGFFFERSRRLLARILNSNPNATVIMIIMNQIAEAGLTEILSAIFRHQNYRILNEIVPRRLHNHWIFYYNQLSRSQ